MSHGVFRLAFLCGIAEPPSRARFEDACRLRGVECLWADPHGPLPSADVAVIRTGGLTSDRALSAVTELETSGVLCIPPSPTLAIVRDKGLVADVLARHAIPAPKTSCPASAAEAIEAFRQLGGRSVVVKARRGMQGNGVVRAQTAEEVAAAFEALHGDVVVQPTVGDGTGTDVRVMVVDGRVLGAIERTPRAGEFAANASRGATVVARPVEQRLADLSIAAARALGLGVAGVDLIEHHGDWLVIEVNSAPGFSAFESVTGVDVAAAIVDYAVTMSAEGNHEWIS